jgi:hypothetical protein
MEEGDDLTSRPDLGDEFPQLGLGQVQGAELRPSCTRSRAVALPMPEPAPVTSATLPSRIMAISPYAVIAVLQLE